MSAEAWLLRPAAAAGLDGAGRCVAQARALLAAAAPRDWRSASAAAFSERLESLARECGRVSDEVTHASREVRALEVELASGRDAVCLASPWWRGP
jgi:hypothetical protein